MQFSNLMGFSHEQVELLREIAREVMRGGVSRQQLADALGVKVSQVSNFVRFAAATKRPKPQEFLLPLHNYVVSQQSREILNYDLRRLVEQYLATLDPNYHGAIGEQKTFKIHFGTIENFKEAELSLQRTGKEAIATLKMQAIGEAVEKYLGVAIGWGSSLTAILKVEQGQRTISITATESQLSGMLTGIILRQGSENGVLAQKCALYETTEIKQSLPDSSDAKLRQITRDLFRVAENTTSELRALETPTS